MLVTLSDFFGVSVDYILCKSDIRYRAEDMLTDTLSQNEMEIPDIFRTLSKCEQDRAIGIVFALKNMR